MHTRMEDKCVCVCVGESSTSVVNRSTPRRLQVRCRLGETWSRRRSGFDADGNQINNKRWRAPKRCTSSGSGQGGPRRRPPQSGFTHINWSDPGLAPKAKAATAVKQTNRGARDLHCGLDSTWRYMNLQVQPTAFSTEPRVKVSRVPHPRNVCVCVCCRGAGQKAHQIASVVDGATKAVCPPNSKMRAALVKVGLVLCFIGVRSPNTPWTARSFAVTALRSGDSSWSTTPPCHGTSCAWR